MPKDSAIKIRGEFTPNAGTTLTDISQAVADFERRLNEMGAAAVKLQVPRGEYRA